MGAMNFDISDDLKKQARSPHNLFVLNVFLFNLLMTPAAIVLDVGMIALLIPPLCSLSVIAYIYIRSKKETIWFVDMHWRLAFRRCQWLMAGYGISAMLVLIAWLLSLTTADAKMAEIMFTAISRVAILPTLLAVMITVVLEAGGFQLINHGEVPDKLVEEYPPPDPIEQP